MKASKFETAIMERLRMASGCSMGRKSRNQACSTLLFYVTVVLLLQMLYPVIPLVEGIATGKPAWINDRATILAGIRRRSDNAQRNKDVDPKAIATGMPKDVLPEQQDDVNVIREDVVAKSVEQRVPVSTVALLTLGMAVATGLGAVPFFFMELEAQWAGMCNGVASGVMIAASFDLIQEGQKYGSGSWVVVGILFGGLFILISQKMLQGFGEVRMQDVKGADMRKMILVVSIMTLHSFGEGSGVGVSFAGSKGLSQGLMVTIAIAVHNIPEGLAVSMVLSQQGISAKHSMLWSIFTSLPQPLVAVPAFLCAEAFTQVLPFCMGFAAGCMIWMVVAEVMPDSFRDASHSQVASAATLSVAFMEGLSAILENFDHAPRWENLSALVVSLFFGLGPFFGGLVITVLASSVRLPATLLTGIGAGVAFVLASWRPLQLWSGGKMNFFQVCSLLGAGAFVHYILRKIVQMKRKSLKAETVRLDPGKVMSPVAQMACLASLMIGFHAFAEGLALGVAAPKAYGLGVHLLLPVSLHGLPRGVSVASTIHGGTRSGRGAMLAAALTGLAGPIAAILAILMGIGYQGLDYWMVLACGSLYPAFGGKLLRRAFSVNPRNAFLGLLLGLVFATACLTSTRLVCLHTPYCNSAPEAVT
jgi:zinc transporter ZupT